MQTAAHLGIKSPKWMIDYNIRERDGGLFNVMPPSKRDSDYVDQQKFYKTQPFYFRPPQGESIADVCMRIKIVLDTLYRECDGENAIIVCHGHVMRTFRIIIERMPLTKINDFLTTEEEWGRIPNCSIIHYTRKNPFEKNMNQSVYLDWIRMICPAGGGTAEGEFQRIERKKFTNEELFAEAKSIRGK